MTRRALYVSAFAPSEQAPHAGGQAAFENRADLERQGFEVTSLICTTERAANAQLNSETIFLQTPAQLFWGWSRSILKGQNFGFGAWPILDTRANTAFEARLLTELQSGIYELVFSDFTQVLLPVWRALQSLRGRPPVRACIHDLYLQRLLRDPGVGAHVFLGAVARTERRLLQWVDEIITLSPKDEGLATTLYDCLVVRAKPFVPPRWIAGVKRRIDSIAPREVLFFANFGRPENLEALTWFVREVLSQVTQRYPDFCLVLCGAGSDSVNIAGDTSRIRRLGFMDDPGPAFARCRLAIAPLARGAGVKFKVLEALACGVPVLGTSIALEGIPQGELVHKASRPAFAARLGELLA